MAPRDYWSKPRSWQQQQPPAAKDVPESAAVFAGTWVDSMSNGVYVEVVDDTPNVTLIKRADGSKKELSLFWDKWAKTWKCGNGFLTELVYQDDAEKGKTLKVVSWVAKNGNESTWFRQALPTNTEEKLSQAVPATKPSVPATPPWRAQENPQSGSEREAPEAPPTVPESSPKDSQLPAASTKGRASWYEITEEWDSTFGPQEFSNLKQQKQAQNGGDQEAQKKKRTRGGRGRRGPRGNVSTS